MILWWYYLIVFIGSYKMKKVDCKMEIIDKFLRMEIDDIRKCFFKKWFEEFKNLWNELLKNKSYLLVFLLKDEDMLFYNSKVIECIVIDDNLII